MDTKGQDLHTILRHIIEKTNFQGDPGAKQEVDDAFGRLFAETEDQGDADDAPSGWDRNDDPVHTENGVRVYAVKSSDGTGVEYVTADENGWRDGHFKTIDAAVKGSDATPATPTKSATTRKR